MKKFFLSLLATSALTLGISAQSVEWSTNPGSGAYEEVGGSAVDADGNVITVGIFMGTVDLNPGAGTFNVTSNGLYDLFIQKLDANGAFLWGGSIGGTNGDYADGVTTDADGNVYVVGNFRGAIDFDISPSSSHTMSSGGGFLQDGFILKLAADGSFMWSDLFGSTGDDGGRKVKVDASGNVYVAGHFKNSCYFDPYGPAPATRGSLGNTDLFLMKLDNVGELIWVHTLGSTGADRIGDFTLDGDEAYLTGYFYANLDPDGLDGPSTSYLPAVGAADAFVMHLDAAGNTVDVVALGGTFDDVPYGIVQSGSNVYVSGGFHSTVDFDPGAGSHSVTAAGSTDGFLLCLDDTLGFNWVKTTGCIGDDYLTGLAEDNVGNLWASGLFESSIDVDFDASGTAVLNNMYTGTDSYVLKMDASGNYLWSGHLAGTATDNAFTMAYGPGTIAVSGNFNDSLDIDMGAGATWMVTRGNYDPFTLKLGICPSAVVGISYTAPTLSTDPGFSSYQWLNAGSPVAGATSSTFDPTTSGIYSVEVTDGGGCVYESDTVKVCLAMTPGISFTEPTLSTDPGFASYQWLLSGSPVAGATGSTFDPTASGVYSVQVTDVYGCTYTSDTLHVVITALSDAHAASTLALSPNPTAGRFTLSCMGASPTAHMVRVMDLAGSVIAEQVVSPVAGNLHVELDLSAQAAGMYLVELNDGSHRSFGRVVKQ